MTLTTSNFHFRQLVVGLSVRSIRFNARPVRVGFMGKKVALGPVLLLLVRFSPARITQSIICHKRFTKQKMRPSLYKTLKIFTGLDRQLGSVIQMKFYTTFGIKRLNCMQYLEVRFKIYIILFQNGDEINRVIHKSLRYFRPLRYSSRDGHAEWEHANRGRDTPNFCPTLQVLDMPALGEAAYVNLVINFLSRVWQ